LAENGGLAKSNISLLRVAEIVGPPWFFGSFRSAGCAMFRLKEGEVVAGSGKHRRHNELKAFIGT